MAVGGMMGTCEVLCGQVLMDRQRHIAIAAKKDMGRIDERTLNHH